MRSEQKESLLQIKKEVLREYLLEKKTTPHDGTEAIGGISLRIGEKISSALSRMENSLANSNDAGTKSAVMTYKTVKVTFKVAGKFITLPIRTSIRNKRLKDYIRTTTNEDGTINHSKVIGSSKNVKIKLTKEQKYRLKMDKQLLKRIRKGQVSIVGVGTTGRLARNLVRREEKIKIRYKDEKRRIIKENRRVFERKIGRKSWNITKKGLDSVASNYDDTGMQTVSAGINGITQGIRTTKMVARATLKTASAFKGTWKNWYGAHKRGAGKSFKDKFFEKFIKGLKKIFLNPIVIGIMALFICSAAVTGGVAVVGAGAAGGVIESLKELAENLLEVVETIVNAVKDFFDGCVKALKKFFGFGKKEKADDPPKIEVTVDINDDMSICEYLHAAVQVYKEDFILGLKEADKGFEDIGFDREELYGEVDAVIYYNYFGKEVRISDGLSTDNFEAMKEGLLSDEEYVRIIMPVWKAIMLGVYDADFSKKEASNVAKECFDIVTNMEANPYIDIDNDSRADYYYCDGTAEKERNMKTVYTRIGGITPSWVKFPDSGHCYSEDSHHQHTTHNTDGLDCCKTSYKCGGHTKYRCAGHWVVTYCEDDLSSCNNKTWGTKVCKDEELATCDNKETTRTYCLESDLSTCTNKGSYPSSGETRYYCQGHDIEACKGHEGEICGGHRPVERCWEGLSDTFDENCDQCRTETIYCSKAVYSSEIALSSCLNRETIFECKCYNVCTGHRMQKVTFGCPDSFEHLLNTMFRDRIAVLNEKKEAGTLIVEDDEYDTDGNVTKKGINEGEELDRLISNLEYAEENMKDSDPITDEYFEDLKNGTLADEEETEETEDEALPEAS